MRYKLRIKDEKQFIEEYNKVFGVKWTEVDHSYIDELETGLNTGDISLDSDDVKSFKSLEISREM